MPQKCLRPLADVPLQRPSANQRRRPLLRLSEVHDLHHPSPVQCREFAMGGCHSGIAGLLGALKLVLRASLVIFPILRTRHDTPRIASMNIMPARLYSQKTTYVSSLAESGLR